MFLLKAGFYDVTVVAGNVLESYNDGNGITVPFEMVRKVKNNNNKI